MSATVACTRCGSADRIVGAYFCDRFKRPSAAIACQRCGLVWPQVMSTQLAADMLSYRGDHAEVTEAMQ